MAGTYEQAKVGDTNASAGPKWVAQFEGMNNKLNSSNLLEDTGLASPNNSAYRTIFSGGPNQQNGTVAASTRYFVATEKEIEATATNGRALLFYFAKADYEVAGKTQKLRLRAQTITGTTAPAVTYTFGLYPLSSVSGGTFTVGSVASGSTVAFATPSGNTLNQANSGDFTIPADGYYAVGIVISGSTAAGSANGFSFQLQTRSV